MAKKTIYKGSKKWVEETKDPAKSIKKEKKE
jgi:hypothetical protein